MPGPLNGIRVVDCSRGTAGPRATGILADYGADVIWVEPPGGDPCREEEVVAYSVYNRGKRSLVLDLTDTADRDLLFALLGRADVFVESWRPGAAGRLGLGYDALHARFPALVYCSISAFGADGPYRDVPGYEAIVYALLGTMAAQAGHREGPIFEGHPFASIGASYLAVIGTLAALYRRHADHTGRHVETSLVDGALVYHSMMWSDTDSGATIHIPGQVRLISGTYLCADGEYLGVHTGAVGGFGRLMTVLGLDDRILPTESGHEMGIFLTPDEAQVIRHELPTIFMSQPRDFWEQRLREADICAIPLLRPGEVFDQPQPVHNEMIVEVNDPALGTVQQVAPPAKFSVTPGVVKEAAPTVGQHSEEIRREVDTADPPTTGDAPRPRADEPVLAGLKILDVGAYFAGPFSSRLLADLGADVIKLEPVAGDPLRGIGVVFRSAQAGKRDIALNLKAPDAEPIARKLLAWADIVHHNLRPGVAERLGVGYEHARAAKPDTVYVYAPGWGSSGPDMHRQSFAPLMSGFVGVGFEVAGEFNPPLFPVGNEDPGNGLLGAVGMLMALLHRERTGEGQLVENPQLNATMAHLAHIVRQPDGTALGAGRLDPVQLGIGPLHRLYQTADGWICLVAVKDADIAALGRVLDIDLLADARFANRDARDTNADALANRLAAAFAARNAAECVAELVAAGVPVAEPVPSNAATFLRDPENRRTGRVAECLDAKDGHVREIAVLVRLSDATTAPHRLAPAIGEHTDEILASLGYRVDEIADLKARNVAR